MDKEKSYVHDGPSRRKSMLPHKTSIKSYLRPSYTLPEQDSYEAAGQRDAPGEAQASAVSQTSQTVQNITMLPPSKSLPHVSMRESAKIGQFPRQSSTSRKSSKDSSDSGACPSQNPKILCEPRPQVRTSSSVLDPRSHARGSHQGRSLSQQVRPTAASDLLPSKSLPQTQSRMKQPRPAFSTMQQHFSPKKPIQPNSTDLSPHMGGRGENSSADVSHLQLELAQLHLLHRSSFSVQNEWEESAKSSLEYQFNALRERHIELKEVAHQQQTLINQLSLVQWAQGRSGAQISENVQQLSHDISDICNLLDPDGKYTHILEGFELWFANALKTREQRESNAQQFGRDLNFIEGIGDGWKAEAMVLERELAYYARDIKSFGEVRSTSSLCRILSMYKKLMVGLLEELDLIQWIENEMMTQEASWIESTIHRLASDVSKDVGSMGPEWKAV